MMKKNNFLYCDNCALRSQSIFKDLTEEEYSSLFYDKSCASYKKNDIVYEEGNRINGFYCINKGIVKIYKTGKHGKEQIIRFACVGDIFGFRSILSREKACTTVKMVEDSTICMVKADKLHQLLKDNHNFLESVLKVLSKELDEANNRIKNIAQRTVKERMAETLISIHEKFGIDDENYLNLKIKREELAEIVGTATESAIRTISQFKKEGIIKPMGRKIKIIKIDKLRELIEY